MFFYRKVALPMVPMGPRSAAVIGMREMARLGGAG
jgi:hypothetical protein